ncbi:class F sortase [Micrococcoides hystricis]|uniref:Class F sortase n=1 Tax=Micrococcoides hystricis TaxID=1572761 RepID=A0ABV6P906_9MICC
MSAYRGKDRIVHAPLDPVGLNSHGYLVPDFNRAGWYAQNGWKQQKPGVKGPAIIAAHVNQLDGEGAVIDDHFAKLHTLVPGDKISVRYSSEDVVSFTVVKSQAVDKVVATDMNGEVAESIWDPGEDKPYLRLFTCDEDTPWVQGHYVGNWVVWAEDATLNRKN